MNFFLPLPPFLRFLRIKPAVVYVTIERENNKYKLNFILQSQSNILNHAKPILKKSGMVASWLSQQHHQPETNGDKNQRVTISPKILS